MDSRLVYLNILINTDTIPLIDVLLFFYPGVFDITGRGSNTTLNHGNRTKNPEYDPCDTTTGLSGAVYTASKYLYSFTIEYSIIAGAMSYIMWKNINRRVKTQRRKTNTEFSFSFECGLLLGVICAMCGGIILIVNIIYIGDPTKAASSFTSYHGYRTFMNIVCILSTVLSVVGIHRGGWNVEHSKNPSHVIDTFLLLLCASGSFLQGFYTIVAAANSIGTDKFAPLILFDELSHMIQAILQCFLILDAIHRKPTDDYKDTRTKQILIFLLVCNITWWLLSTYELKGGSDIFPLEKAYYGKTAWYVIVHLAAPFDILFRFHSSVMLFEIWTLKSDNDDEETQLPHRPY